MQHATPRMSPDEFLAWEREQPTRHHYLGGQVFDMAGGSPRHNSLGAEIAGTLASSLRGQPCRTFSADQKIGLSNDEFVYADASVACPPFSFRPGSKDVVTNPVVIVEVLSKSTETYDRGDKFEGYIALPSVRHVLLVSQQRAKVELYTRQTDGSFRYETFGAGGTVRLTDPEATFSVDALYAGVFELPGDE
jgi:Uma2 family endonuclease